MKINHRKILEAVEHAKDLAALYRHMMLEKTSPLLQHLKNTYGKNCLTNDEMHYIQLSNKLVIDIYDCINTFAFNNKMKMPSISSCDEFIGTNHIAGYKYCFFRHMNENKYTLVTEPCYINGKIALPPCIHFNPQIGKMPLMFFVNILAHEMIHQFNLEHENTLELRFQCQQQNKKYDPHCKIFLDHMKRINDVYGLNIKVFGGNMKDEFNDASLNIKNFDLNEAKEVEGVELFDQPIKVDVGSEFVDCWQFGPDFFEETVF